MKKSSPSKSTKTVLPPESSLIAKNVRDVCGIAAGTGPTDENITKAVLNFAKIFDYWYTRVLKDVVGLYRERIISRINPLIRRFQYPTLESSKFATLIIEDYDRRNFVTAGGWALETLALSIRPEPQSGSEMLPWTVKSEATGVDLRRYDPKENKYSFYVLKSGTVTRNSDIVDKLKQNLRHAHDIVMQNSSEANVSLNWAVCTGKTKTTTADGIRRPSSAKFWSEIIGLPEDAALKLISAMSSEAHLHHNRDLGQHINALNILVSIYIEKPNSNQTVDWDFLNKRNFDEVITWKTADLQRHEKALAILAKTGYIIPENSHKSAKRGRDSLPTDIPLPKHLLMSKDRTLLDDV